MYIHPPPEARNGGVCVRMTVSSTGHFGLKLARVFGSLLLIFPEQRTRSRALCVFIYFLEERILVFFGCVCFFGADCNRSCQVHWLGGPVINYLGGLSFRKLT